MNIKRAKQEIKDTIEAYLLKDEYGEYVIPQIRQRPVLLLGAPGIGKTQIMEQIARECRVGLVSYTITHHTRQSAIGLPFISKKEFGGKEYSVTEYTMSEIVASIYNKIEKTGLKEGILFIDEINCVSETLAPAMLQFLQCKMFGNHEEMEDYLQHFTVKGFGGTDFRPAFLYVQELLAKKTFTKLRGLIYFTDGYGTFPMKKPPYDTAFVFMKEDYRDVDVPPWAMKLILEKEELMDCIEREKTESL